MNKHNGWTNYETWVVHLWLDNHKSDESYWANVAIEIANNANSAVTKTNFLSKSEVAMVNLADRIKIYYVDAMNEFLAEQNLEVSVWSDLLNRSMSTVNWDEIAENLLSDFSNVGA